MADQTVRILIEGKDSLTPAAKQASGALDGVQKSASGLNNVLRNALSVGIGMVGMQLTQNLIGGLTGAFDAMQTLGAETRKLSMETGMSAETASALLDVFEDYAGVGIQGASTALGMFAKRLAGIQDAFDGIDTGGKSFDAIMADLGVRFRTTSGDALPLEDVLMDLADKFQTMPNGVEKTAVAMNLFGRSGKDMIPVLNLGSQGIREAMAAAEKYGVTLTQNNVTAIYDFTMAQKDMNDAMMGIQMSIGTAVLPALTNLVTGIADAISSVRDLTKSFQDNAIAAGLLMGVITSIGVVVGIYATQLAVATGATLALTAAQWLLNAAMYANPIVIVVGLLAGLVAALITAYNTSEDFRNAVDNAFQMVAEAAATYLAALGNNLANAVDAAAAFANGVIDAINTMVSVAGDLLGGMVRAVAGWGQGIVSIASAVSMALGGPNLLANYAGAVNDIATGLEGWTGPIQHVQSAGDGIRRLFGDLANNVMPSVIDKTVAFDRTMNQLEMSTKDGAAATRDAGAAAFDYEAALKAATEAAKGTGDASRYLEGSARNTAMAGQRVTIYAELMKNLELNVKNTDAAHRYLAEAQRNTAMAAQKVMMAEELEAKAAGGAAAATRDLAAAMVEALGGTQAMINALIATNPATIALNASIAGLKAQIAGLEAAQRANQDASRAAQEAMRQLQERASMLSDQLSQAKQRLDDLANVRLVGMGAADEQIRQFQRRIDELRLKKLEMPLGADTTAIDQAIELLQRQLEAAQLRKGLKFDDLLRKLQEAAHPTGKEMTFAQAMKAIKDTQGEIKGLEVQLSAANAAVKAQEAAIRALDQASYLLSQQMQALQAQLQIQQDKLAAVNEALMIAYKWYVEDRPKITELGAEGERVAGVIDEKVTGLLAAVDMAVSDTSANSAATLSALVKDYQVDLGIIAMGVVQGLVDKIQELNTTVITTHITQHWEQNMGWLPNGGSNPTGGGGNPTGGEGNGGGGNGAPTSYPTSTGTVVLHAGGGGRVGIDEERLAAAMAQQPVYVYLDGQLIAVNTREHLRRRGAGGMGR